MTPFILETEGKASVGVFSGLNRIVLSTKSELTPTVAAVTLTLLEAEDLIKALSARAAALRVAQMEAQRPVKRGGKKV